MTDIVERLKQNIAWLKRDGFLTTAGNLENALAEIERLRELLRVRAMEKNSD